MSRRPPHRRLRTHPYTPDPTVPADWYSGTRHCATCGLPQQHQRHTMPEHDPELRAAELRRAGERED